MNNRKKLSNHSAGILLIGFFLTLLFGCQKEEIHSVFIDEQLQEYFDRFQSEGQLRGSDVDFNLIKVEGLISTTLEPSISGQCQHDSNYPDRILINERYWKQANAMEKEFLVFHELGHCYLQRSHLDVKDLYGNCISIMHSGANACRNNYNHSTRDTYLDELFNPSEDE